MARESKRLSVTIDVIEKTAVENPFFRGFFRAHWWVNESGAVGRSSPWIRGQEYIENEQCDRKVVEECCLVRGWPKLVGRPKQERTAGWL